MRPTFLPLVLAPISKLNLNQPLYWGPQAGKFKVLSSLPHFISWYLCVKSPLLPAPAPF